MNSINIVAISHVMYIIHSVLPYIWKYTVTCRRAINIAAIGFALSHAKVLPEESTRSQIVKSALPFSASYVLIQLLLKTSLILCTICTEHQKGPENGIRVLS